MQNLLSSNKKLKRNNRAWIVAFKKAQHSSEDGDSGYRLIEFFSILMMAVRSFG